MHAPTSARVAHTVHTIPNDCHAHYSGPQATAIATSNRGDTGLPAHCSLAATFEAWLRPRWRQRNTVLMHRCVHVDRISTSMQYCTGAAAAAAARSSSWACIAHAIASAKRRPTRWSASAGQDLWWAADQLLSEAAGAWIDESDLGSPVLRPPLPHTCAACFFEPNSSYLPMRQGYAQVLRASRAEFTDWSAASMHAMWSQHIDRSMITARQTGGANAAGPCVTLAIWGHIARACTGP